jgi:hypothetical protein
MAGKFCDGVVSHITKSIKNMKAYEEGVQARMNSGGDLTPPAGFPAGGEQEKCWQQGDFDADPVNDAVAACSAYRGQTGPVEP